MLKTVYICRLQKSSKIAFLVLRVYPLILFLSIKIIMNDNYLFYRYILVAIFLSQRDLNLRPLVNQISSIWYKVLIILKNEFSGKQM